MNKKYVIKVIFLTITALGITNYHIFASYSSPYKTEREERVYRRDQHKQLLEQQKQERRQWEQERRQIQQEQEQIQQEQERRLTEPRDPFFIAGQIFRNWWKG